MAFLPEETRQVVNTGQGPQAEAYQWMAGDSALRDRNFTTPQLEQRFAMATIYYATNGPSWTKNDLWLSHDDNECNWRTKLH